MFLLCREKERLYHAKPFTRGTTAAIGSNRGGPYNFLKKVLFFYLLTDSALCEHDLTVDLD